MIEIALNQAVVAIVGFAIAGVLGYLVGKMKSLSKFEKARIIIEKASARAHIKEAYQRYVIEKQRMTIAAYDELLEEYEAYQIMGGNGTAKAYMGEIVKLKPYLVLE